MVKTDPLVMVKIAYAFSNRATGKAMLKKYPWLSEMNEEWWLTVATLFECAIVGAPLSNSLKKKALATNNVKLRVLLKNGDAGEKALATEIALEQISNGGGFDLLPMAHRKGNAYLAAVRKHIKNVLITSSKNTSRIHLTEWNKEIFDAPTLDLLIMSPWFCGEAARIFRDCPHLVGNWLTASWLNKARALGALK